MVQPIRCHKKSFFHVNLKTWATVSGFSLWPQKSLLHSPLLLSILTTQCHQEWLYSWPWMFEAARHYLPAKHNLNEVVDFVVGCDILAHSSKFILTILLLAHTAVTPAPCCSLPCTQSWLSQGEGWSSPSFFVYLSFVLTLSEVFAFSGLSFYTTLFKLTYFLPLYAFGGKSTYKFITLPFLNF